MQRLRTKDGVPDSREDSLGALEICVYNILDADM